MERLTLRSNQTSHDNGVCCTHFNGPECIERSGNCVNDCPWEEAVWSRLADYEDTGLTPETVMALAEALREGRLLVEPRNMAEKRTIPVNDLYDEDGGDVLGGGGPDHA